VRVVSIPVVRVLGTRRPYAMKDHHLPCGHTIPLGERYVRTSLLVGGNFKFHKECNRCFLEAILDSD
jgi:hypothetical protein